MQEHLDEYRVRGKVAIIELVRSRPVDNRKCRLFMVASVSERLLAILPPEYRRMLHYIERFADLPGPNPWANSSAAMRAGLSEADRLEVKSLYDSLGPLGCFMDMMCRRALRGWVWPEENWIWHTLANPFSDGLPPYLDLRERGTPSRDWRAAVPPEEELAGLRRIEQLIECILFRPSRGVLVDSSVLAWNGGAVRKLACAIYKDRSFADLPILADALEEAECHEQSMLSHCRQPRLHHGRGCWVVDLLADRGTQYLERQQGITSQH